MSGTAASSGYGDPAMVSGSGEVAAERDFGGGLWWIWLVTGILWIIASLVVLQFDSASITTIGVIVGIMFMFAGVQQFALMATTDRLRWLWAIFGVLFIAAGIICVISPKNTFVAMADILGFLFLTVGVWWTIRAFIEKSMNPLWWVGLVGGIMMLILAFWTSGQLFLEKAYTLIVFAGIWAMMQGVSDIIRAFAVRNAGEDGY